MIENYAALAKIRLSNPALTDGSLRFIYASNEAFAFIREHKQQAILVFASRKKDSAARIPGDALLGVKDAERLFGTGKLRSGKRGIEFDAKKMSVTIWRLPAQM